MRTVSRWIPTNCASAVSVVCVLMTLCHFVSCSVANDDLLQRVRAAAAQADRDEFSVFEGSRITSTTIRSLGKPSNSTEKTERWQSTFDCYDSDVWRFHSEGDNDGFQYQAARDGSFIFEAIPTDSGFHFGAQGYHQIAFETVFSSMMFRNPLVGYSTWINAEQRPMDFFSSPGFTINEISETQNEQGIRIETISWDHQATEDTSLGDCFGELSWMPDHHYLITSAKFGSGKRKADSTYLFVTHIDYQDVNGKFLPIRVNHTDGHFVYLTTLDESGPCNPDRKFYTAEAFGLKTPLNPFFLKLMWGGAAAAFLILAFIAFRWWKH